MHFYRCQASQQHQAPDTQRRKQTRFKKELIFMKNWFYCAGVRAAKTMAQTAVSLIPVAVSITEVDWVMVLGTSALVGLLSVLTSIAGLPEVKE